jgi:hypothetical protein
MMEKKEWEALATFGEQEAPCSLRRWSAGARSTPDVFAAFVLGR